MCLLGTRAQTNTCQHSSGGIHDILVVDLTGEAVDDGIADVVQSVDEVQKMGQIKHDSAKQGHVANKIERCDADRELQHSVCQRCFTAAVCSCVYSRASTPVIMHATVTYMYVIMIVRVRQQLHFSGLKAIGVE